MEILFGAIFSIILIILAIQIRKGKGYDLINIIPKGKVNKLKICHFLSYCFLLMAIVVLLIAIFSYFNLNKTSIYLLVFFFIIPIFSAIYINKSEKFR